jgi:hypothetical protein
MIENPVNKKNDIEKSHIDSALGTALYILRCIHEGQSRKEIVQSLDSNVQYVTVWIQYLKAISWLKEDAQGNLLASEDGKLRIQQYEKAIQSKLHETNSTYQKFKNDKYQEELVLSFQSAYAKFIETSVMYFWNFYWWWILPISNRITETYTVAVCRLLDNTRIVSKAANETVSAI